MNPASRELQDQDEGQSNLKIIHFVIVMLIKWWCIVHELSFFSEKSLQVNRWNYISSRFPHKIVSILLNLVSCIPLFFTILWNSILICLALFLILSKTSNRFIPCSKPTLSEDHHISHLLSMLDFIRDKSWIMRETKEGLERRRWRRERWKSNRFEGRRWRKPG